MMRRKVESEKKGGRKKASLADPDLVPKLKQNLETHTAGSPVEPGELWTNRSATQLANELSEQGHPVDRKTLQHVLRDELGLGHRQISKKLTMDESADRDAQFQLVQKYKAKFLGQGFPVLSIDTKKKELLGEFHRRGSPRTTLIEPYVLGVLRQVLTTKQTIYFGVSIPSTQCQ